MLCAQYSSVLTYPLWVKWGSSIFNAKRDDVVMKKDEPSASIQATMFENLPQTH